MNLESNRSQSSGRGNESTGFAWDLHLMDDPVPRTQRSPKNLITFLEWHFGSKAIRILEIGVFKGGLSQALRQSKLNIQEYVGVDPYLGTGNDPYLGAYWENKASADALFAEMCGKFRGWGFTLERTFSAEYLSRLDSNRLFDFVYVDGDHRILPALWDCCLALKRIEIDGILGIDDYANSDTPEVTLAVNEFVRSNRGCIRRAAMIEESFCNALKFFPIVQRSVLLQAVDRGDRLQVALPKRKMGAVFSMREAILDLNLRKVVQFGRKLVRR